MNHCVASEFEIRARAFKLLRLRHHDIDAGLEVADGLIDRERGRDVGIESSLLHRKLALPDRLAARIAELVDLVTGEAVLKIAAPGILVADGVGKAAVADAIDLDRDRARVGADDRNSALPGTRQDIGAGGKVRERLAVAHVDGKIGRLRQGFVHHGRQTGAQRDRVALTVLQSFDAKLFLGCRQRGLVGAGHDDERREVGALRQVLGELEAGARRSRVGIDRVIERPESVLIAQPFILPAHVGYLAQFKRKAKRVERGAPFFALGEHVAEEREAVGLLVADRGPLVGDIGRGRGALEQELAFVVVGRANLHHRAREAEPRRGVVRRRGDNLAEQSHAGAEIVAGERAVRVAPDLRHRLRGRARVGLDLRLERNRAVREVLVLERLVRGNGGERHGKQQHGGNAGPNNRKHGCLLPGGCAISPTRGFVATIVSQWMAERQPAGFTGHFPG